MGVIINPIISYGGVPTFVTTSDIKAASGKYPYTNITAKNADVTFQVNNIPVIADTFVWDDLNFHLAFGMYDLLYGSIVNIPMAIAATAGYTAPTATIDAVSAAKGVVISSDILPMISGIVNVIIKTPGSGYTGDFLLPMPGGNPESPANMVFTVVNGAVTAIKPFCGTWWGCGVGYPGTFDSSIDYLGGTGCTFTCVVGNCIENIPVLQGGSNLLLPPVITIIDNGPGAGAIASPTMSGPTASDIVTYSAPDNWLVTSAGSVTGATNAPMFNYYGQIEGKAVSLSGFDIQRTMKVGGQHPPQPTYNQESEMFTGKDKMFASDGWNGSNVTLDANLNPVSWTPGGTITNLIYQSATGLAHMYEGGPWTIKFIDNSPPGVTTSFTLTASGIYTAGVAAAPTINGNIVTIEVPLTLGWEQGGFTYVNVIINWTSSDGLNHVVHPNNPNVFRPLVMAPGNTDNGLYYDADDVFVNNLILNGVTPGDIRGMDALWGYAGINNFCTLADKMPANLSIWSKAAVPKIVQFQFARRLSTDPTDTSVPWKSTKIYNPQGWIPSGTDDYGIYFNIADGPFGATDAGRVLLQNWADTKVGIIELRTTDPEGHGLQTGQTVLINPNNGAGYPIPWALRGVVNNTFFPGFDINLSITATNSDTIAFGWPFTTEAGSGPDTVNSNTEIPVSIACILTTPIGSPVPTEYLATLVSRLPNTRLWMNLPSIGTNQHDLTGYNYSEGYKCAKILGPTNGVNLEMGNEPWNWGISTFSYYFQEIQANWAAYAPKGMKIYGGYAIANGQPTPDSYIGVNVYASAQAFDAFVAGWVAGGRSASDVKRMLSSGWGFSGITGTVIPMAQAASIPVDGTIVAPYVGIGGAQSSSILLAYRSAGAGKNWSASKLNDLQSFFVAFNTSLQDQWASHAQYANAVGMPLVGYEGGYQNLVPDGLPNGPMISQDLFQHSSFGPAMKRLLVWAQEGDRTRSGVGAGLELFNYYCLYYTNFGEPEWTLGNGITQPTGPGFDNLFFTLQGGKSNPGAHTLAQANQAIGINEILKFNSISDVPFIVSELPLPNSINIPITSVVSATFNEDIQPLTLNVTVTDSTGLSVKCTGSYSNNTVTLTPIAPLAYGMIYTAAVNAAVNNLKAPMSTPFIWTFTTVSDPTVDPYKITVDNSNIIKYQPATITIAVTVPYDGVVNFTDSSDEGLFYPPSLTYDNSNPTQKVMYIPGSLGVRTITITSTPNLINTTIDITAIAGSADSFTLVGPTTNITIGTTSTGYVITPNGFYIGTIFLFDVSLPFFIPAGGVFDPPFLVFSNIDAPQSFSYTANASGKKIIYAVAFPNIGMNKPITLEIP